MIQDAEKPTPGSLLGAGSGGSEINRVRYRRAKETKCGGKDVRKSEYLDRTEEAGELDPREPGGWEASSTAIGTIDTAHGNNTDRGVAPIICLEGVTDEPL